MMSRGNRMRRIRFKPELIEAIRQGRKTMTFRTTERPHGDYIVEEGGHPYWVHIDTGLRICICLSWSVGNIEKYADEYYDLEGFSSPQEFLDYVSKLYKGKLPKGGWAHVFWATENDVDLANGRNIPLAREVASKMAQKFPEFTRELHV